MSLIKAKLKHRDGGDDIVFMFNPAQLSFDINVNTIDNAGARATRSGRPMVSFSNIRPKTLTIDEIHFDTYEIEKDVFDEYIKAFVEATQFLDKSGQSKPFQRPPIFSFIWGKTYLDYCFIERFNYKLTKFLPNGMPVRAVISGLTLKETEKPSDDANGTPKAQANPDVSNRKT